MDGHRFDGFVKAFAASGASRRRFLARLAGGASGGTAALLGLGAAAAQEPTPAPRQVTRVEAQDPATTGGAVCRQDGESCGGDQLCCGGLLCSPTGKDQATRCVSELEPVETCADSCEPTEVVAQKPRVYRVEAACAYDDAEDRTTCDCAASAEEADAPAVKRVTISQADVCGEVVGGDAQEDTQTTTRAGGRANRRAADRSTNTANAGNAGEANADASGGAVTVGDVEGNNQVAIDASGGTAQADASGGSGNVAIAGGRGARFASAAERNVLQLTFAGRVEPTGTATYWCETDAGVVPATGPALTRVREELADVGEILVRAAACDIADAEDGYDWFGKCRRPAKAMLRLRTQQGRRFVDQETAATDDGGRRTFRGLVAGLYRLAPEGEGWCHAECDSVDENGDVVLEAGQRATLYVFNCNRGRPNR